MDCFSPDCQNPVFYQFTWGWGVPAACCREHQVHAQQVHDAQERGKLTFAPIDPSAEVVPLARDERTRLIAAQMSAEQEADEVKTRAAGLYNLNTELQGEVRRLRARNQEADLQLADRAADIERLTVERDEALADLHDAQTELERIKMLIPRDAPPTPRDRPNVVG
jgi:capsule polysaccharide export protein KpsE/RkpR